MLGNITRNGFKNQWTYVLAKGQTPANVSGTDVHGGHFQQPNGCLAQVQGFKSGVGPRKTCASSYTYCSKLGDLAPSTPGIQGLCLVFSNDEGEFGTGEFGPKFKQRVHGVAGAGAYRLARVDHHALQVGKGQARHGQPMDSRRQLTAFMPCLAGGNDAQLVQLQLLQSHPRQCMVGCMGRIKRTTEHPDAPLMPGRHRHTQSRRGRNWVYSAASGEPASGTAW